MQFRNPPLVELVVELKWVSTGASQNLPGFPVGFPHPIPPHPDHEEFLTRFTEVAADAEWPRSERLIPLGFPTINFQPVMRVRSSRKDRQGMVLQAGPGVFSAHALPPYRNWESFLPVVKEGVEILLKARSESEKASPFISIHVMYMDLFQEYLVGDYSVREFLHEILGIAVSLPLSITEQSIAEDKIEPQLSLKIPLRSGLEMRLNIAGDSVVGDKKGILMTTTVLNPQGVEAKLESILDVLEGAHVAIRATFMGMTAKLHHRMNPFGELA